ncbi:integral membrane protein, partial [mine drainage metagenome]
MLEPGAGQEAYARLSELFARLDPACLAMDPIAVLELMAGPYSPAACAPLIYGYVSYCRSGAHGAPIAFGDLAPLVRGGPRSGSALGGTGIAVSAQSPEREAATAFARWVADAEAQSGPYLAAGGQPAHRAAWEDPLANRDSLDFFRNTRATLEGAWIRPRHAGYMTFQVAAAERLNEALAMREPAAGHRGDQPSASRGIIMSSTTTRRTFLKSAASAAGAGLVARRTLWPRRAKAAGPDTTAVERLYEFDYADVALTGGPLKEQYDFIHAHYLALDNDRLLQVYRQHAGLHAPGIDMGGWYGKGGFIPGHAFGQYVSGIARFGRCTGDDACRHKVHQLIHGFAKALDANPVPYAGEGAWKVWPAYVLDKHMIGLIDAYYMSGV